MEQRIAKNIWDSGCYFLSILKHFGKEDEAIKWYKECTKAGVMDEECFIKDPVRLIKIVVGQTYTVMKATATDDAAEFIVARFYNPKTGGDHFVLVDEDSNVIYDPMGTSNTVKNGYIESYRLYYKL